MKALKEGKAFLFKDSTPAAARQGSGKPVIKPKAGETSEGGWAKTVAESLNKETSKPLCGCMGNKIEKERK